MCSKTPFHGYIDKSNFCANFKRTSKFVEDVDKVDYGERIYDDKFNKDCVVVFLTVDDDDDDANRNTAANIMVSIACTALSNVLPSYSCNVPEYIINTTEDDLAIPPIEKLEVVIMNSSRSVSSKLSYDLSVTDSVSNFRKPFMMKDKNYDNSNGILRTLENSSKIISEEEIKNMNLQWKNSTMISFSTWGRNCLHGFLPLHLWVNITLNETIMEKYFVLSQKRFVKKKVYYLKSCI